MTRFFGEAAYRQLTELYRALRLSINCFQPRVLLQSKSRDGSRVRRTYDQAQAPLQRLMASSVLDGAKQQGVERVTQALDPIRLLQQLEHLQQALWRPAVSPTALPSSSPPDPPLRFRVQQCTEEEVPREGITAAPLRWSRSNAKRVKKVNAPMIGGSGIRSI